MTIYIAKLCANIQHIRYVKNNVISNGVTVTAELKRIDRVYLLRLTGNYGGASVGVETGLTGSRKDVLRDVAAWEASGASSLDLLAEMPTAKNEFDWDLS